MSRISVWLIYALVVSLIFAAFGHLPDQAYAVAIFLLGAGSSLAGHWLCNRNWD